MSSLGDAYVHLRVSVPEAGSEQLVSRPVGVTVPGGEVLAALDEHGRKHLLVPVPGSFAGDFRSRGVSFAPRELRVEGEGRIFADLFCTDSRLALVYEHLARDTLERLRSSTDVIASMKSTLEEWRELLRAAAGVGLSREETLGIVGELEVLKMLALADPAAALAAWTGPRGAAHDFHHAGRALEVKSTAGVDPNFITVSNLDQLDPGTVEELRLVVVHCREDDTAPDLDERMRSLFALGVDRLELIKLVGDQGHVFELGAAQHRFKVRGVRSWLVDDDFPGLTSGRIDAQSRRGVSRVSYQLDLDVAQQRPALGEKAEEIVKQWLV